MRATIRGVFIGLAAAGLCAAGARRAEAACDHVVLAELPVEIEGGPISAAPMSSGRVDGRSVRILVDTGADVSTLTPAAIGKLGLPGVYEAKSMDRPNGQVQVPSFSVGTLTASGLTLKAMGAGAGPNSPDMRLGVDLLLPMYADLDIDLPHKKVRLIRADGCTRDQVVYWQGGYAVGDLLDPQYPGIYAEVRVDGMPLKARFDSSVYSVLGAEGLRKLRLPAGAAPQFKTFAFSQESIQNPAIPVGELPRFEQGEPDMVIGLDFMLSHRIYVARSQRKLYVSYVGGRAFAPAPPAP